MNNLVVNSRLIQRFFEVDVIGLYFTRSLEDISRFSISKVFQTMGYAIRIFTTVLRRRPDLVYFTIAPRGFAFYRDAVFVLILKLLAVRIVFHIHGQGIKMGSRKSMISRSLYRWVFRDVHVICLSELLVEDLVDIYDGKPYIVPNGVGHAPMGKSFYPARLPAAVPKILYLSNYFKSKGLLVLLDAMATLKERGCHFVLKLVGAPGDLSCLDLKEIISDKGMDTMVEILGPLYGDEKYQQLCNADIFVHPTCFDAFPLVILEAMQCGLPVVSTREGGIPDIVLEGTTGFLSEKGDSNHLAEHIATLIEDQALRLEMGKKAQRRFNEKYTFAKFEQNITGALVALVDEKHTAVTRQIDLSSCYLNLQKQKKTQHG